MIASVIILGAIIVGCAMVWDDEKEN